MNFWNFIYSTDELKKFFDILKPLKENEVYYALSCARHKYLVSDLNFKMRNTEVLDKKLIRQYDFNKFEKSITKLGIPEDFYKDENDNSYPFNSYVLYITINPRDTMKATYSIVNNLTKLLYDSSKSNTEIQKSKRLDIITMSEIQAATGSKYFLDVDIDITNKEIAKEYVSILKQKLKDCTLIPIETRGGFHLLIEISSIPKLIKNTFYKDIIDLKTQVISKNIGDIEFKSDSMVPIPGTIQGGFEVVIKDIKEF